MTIPSDQTPVRVLEVRSNRVIFRGALVDFERACELADADCSFLRSDLARFGSHQLELMTAEKPSAWRLHVVDLDADSWDQRRQDFNQRNQRVI